MSIDDGRLYDLLCNYLPTRDADFRLTHDSLDRVREWKNDNPKVFENVGFMKCFETWVWQYTKPTPTTRWSSSTKRTGRSTRWMESRMQWNVYDGTGYPPFNDWLCENDDFITADVWFQCCLLGDVVYG